MSFKPLIVAGKKLNENAYRELPQDSMNTGKKNEKSSTTSDSSVYSSLQFEAASSNSNLSEVIKQERELFEARQAARRRKTFAYDGDISTEIHLTLGISSTEMPSKLEESLQPHSTSSRQSVGPETMKKRSDSNVSSHKKCFKNESKLVGDTDIECEKNLTSRSDRLDVQTNVSDKVVAAREANYQEINSTASERNKDVNGTVLIENNCSKGSALASENRFYASRNSSRKKSISAQFSSDKKVENSASKTSNSLPSTEKDAVQQFSSSISALNFDEKCSSSFEKAVNIEREEANARQLARRRKTLRSGSNYDEIHLTKEMMQSTSSSNTKLSEITNLEEKSACTTRSNSRTKSADLNSKAQATSNLVDEDDKMHTSVATRRTRNSNSRAKSHDLNSKTHANSNLVEEYDRKHSSVAKDSTRKSNSRAKSGDSNSKVLGASNLAEEDDKMHTSVAMRRTRNSNTRAKSANFDSKAHATSNLVENNDGMHTSVAAHRARKSNSRATSGDSNSKVLGASNLAEEDDKMHTSVAMRRTRNSNTRAKSANFDSKAHATSNLVENDDRMRTSVDAHRTRRSNSRAKSSNFNSGAPDTLNLVEDDGRMHTSVAAHRARKSNSRATSGDSNSKVLGASNLAEEDDKMHTSVAMRRTRNSNTRAKSANFDSKAHATSNLVENNDGMHTSVAAHRARKSNSRATSGDSNSKVLGTSNLAEEDDKMHTSVAMRRTRNSNTRAKSANFDSKAHATSNLVENDDRMRTSVDAHRTRRSNSRAKSSDFNSDASDTPNLRDVDDRMHASVAAHSTRKSNSRAKSANLNSKAHATSNFVEEDDRMRTSITSSRTRKSKSRAKSGDFDSKTPATSNLVEDDDRMHTSVSSALSVEINSKREAENSNLALWNGTTESKLAVALPVQDHVFKKTPTSRSKKRSFPFSSTPSTNFNKAEMPDLPSLGDLSTIISLHAPEDEKIRSGIKSRERIKNFVNRELAESVSRVDCTNDDATKTALIASCVIEKSEKIANNESLPNKESNGKQTIPDVVPAHSFRSPESCNVQRKNKLKKLGRRRKKNIKRYPAFSTPNLQSGQGDVMKCPVFSSELSSITSLPAKDTNSLKSMDCQSSSKQRLSCESTEKQSKRLSLRSLGGSQACDIAAAGNDFCDVKALISENVQKSDVENCQTGNADSDQVMKKSSGCEEIEEIDSKRLADLVSAMSENTSVTPISCFKKPSGSLDNTAILKRFGVDSECDDVVYEEEIDEIIPANRKNLSVIQQSTSEKEESEEKMSCIAENTNVSFEEDALSLSSDNLSVGRKRSSTAILHNEAKEISNENGSSSESTSFHSEAECSGSIYPVNARWKKVRKLSTSTERSTSTLSGSENDSGIVTPKRHPRAASLFEQLMRKRISSAMNKATSSTEGSSSQKNDQNSNTELPTPKINWGDLRKKTPNLRRSNRTRIPTLRRQLGESVVYRYVNGLPEVERVIHGKVMGKVFLRYGAANSAALVEARRRRRRFLEYRRKMKKLQRERNEALRRRRLSLTEAQSSLME
ncbi:Extracellular matrix-binding protein EbhA [Trichinella spiralis]|uniref:Extracellular matrix-binding protein EbhA n=1 Tax=Trichinella spiralis TaxID=6334 RepID=A0ABR3KC30_TRISP